MEVKHFGMKMQCELCEFSGTRQSVRAHKKRKHDTKDFPCADCAYVGKTKAKYEYHRETKHPDQEYLCDKCDVRFTSRSAHSRHMHHQHKYQPRSCDQCSYTGKSGIHLRLHIRSKHSPLSFEQCPQCSFQSKKRTTLRYHVRVTHEGIKFQCDKCGKECRSPSKLTEHRRVCGIPKQKVISNFTMETSTGCESQDCCRLFGN
jgi:KRAB domain-containing zinc finger protein